MLHITINGIASAHEAGGTVLDALRQCGQAVPHLCHDDRLKPYGACRLCMVEVVGLPHVVASCSTQLQDGMVINTHSKALRQLRQTNLSLMTNHYPLKAVSVEPEHPFHQLLAEYGLPEPTSTAPIKQLFCDESHPYLGVDMSRCINCNRCVRICDEVQGQFVWQVWNRGEKTLVAPNDGKSLLSSGCVACGACVDTCPSGAIYDKRSRPATAWTRSTCVYCGVGCQLDVGTNAGQVVAIKPAIAAVNKGHLCVKGRYAYEFNHSPDRIRAPLLREGNEWRTATWDEALDFIATRLMQIIERDGPDSVGVLGSARATNEENYLAQKFARVVIGTNNVDCCARVCHTPTAKAMKTMLGTGAATNTFDDIERAGLLLLCGVNPTENHPIVGARIKQAVRHGAKLIVVDPRRIELAHYADIHLAVKPGGNVALFNAMAATILEEGLAASEFVNTRVAGLDEYSHFIAYYAPEQMAAECGVAAADIRAAARLYASTAPAMCIHGLGMTEHTQGSEGVMTLINLALLTGNLGKPGSGINPLRGQNNVQGAAHMGCDPATLTGSQSFTDAGYKFSLKWGRSLPTSHGLDLLQMMDAANDGKLKALWAFGYDIYQTLANAHKTADALQKMELLVIQDLFMNETARAFGHVFLPAASVFERDGTFMNSDRRVQRIRQAILPPGEAKSDWWILQAIAQRMGHSHGFDFDGPESIWNEVRELWAGGAGLSYQRLENEDLHWPCPHTSHPGTPILHEHSFALGPRASLACIPFVPTSEACDDDYPLLLTTGRTLYHFNSGTMSYRTPNAELRPSDTLDMSPEDAQELALHEGDQVQVDSRYGTAQLPVRISKRIKRGELFASFHRADLLLNRITSAERDRLVHAPEYKVTAVRVSNVKVLPSVAM